MPISHYKGWIFLFSGLIIAFSGFLTLWPKGKVACSITGGQGCEVAGRFTKFMFWSAVTMWVVGAFVAYLLTPILRVVWA